MSMLLLFALVLVIGSCIYLFYLNQQEDKISTPDDTLNDSSPVSQQPGQPASQGTGDGSTERLIVIGNVAGWFLNMVIQAISFSSNSTSFLPMTSMSPAVYIYFFQIGINAVAAVFCFLGRRSDLASTFLLCSLTVCLIGPLVLPLFLCVCVQLYVSVHH